MSNIRSILRHHSIAQSVERIETALLSKLDYPGGNTRTLTLMIYMDQVIPSTSSWARARDDLRSMFSAHGLKDVEVEIYDRKRAFMPWLLPLKPDDNAVVTYESKRNAFLSVVKEHLQNAWIAMSLFKLGSRSDSIKPALVVMVRPRSFRNWAEISSRLRTIWPDPNIPIEFLLGNVNPSTGISLRSRLVPHSRLGSSIGEYGEVGAGTLGGHVILERDGVKHLGVLTNHHVVRPSTAIEDTIRKLDQHGYGPKVSHFETFMQYSALDDHNATKTEIERLISAHEALVKEVEAVLRRFEMKEQDPPEKQLSRLSMIEEALKDLKVQQELNNKLPIILGKVLCSSGQAMSPRRSIVDWAFVMLNDTIAFPERPNRLSNAAAPGLLGKLSDYFEASGVLYSASDANPAHACYFDIIKKGGWYFKVGRSFGTTAGVCHGTEIEVARVGQIRWNERGERITLGRTSTRELMIMGKARQGWEPDVEVDIPETFSIDGDSGSFVINGYGEVAGLLYGAFIYVGLDNRLRMNVGLVTSMDEVLESIRATTGGELALP